MIRFFYFNINEKRKDEAIVKKLKRLTPKTFQNT